MIGKLTKLVLKILKIPIKIALIPIKSIIMSILFYLFVLAALGGGIYYFVFL